MSSPRTIAIVFAAIILIGLSVLVHLLDIRESIGAQLSSTSLLLLIVALLTIAMQYQKNWSQPGMAIAIASATILISGIIFISGLIHWGASQQMIHEKPHLELLVISATILVTSIANLAYKLFTRNKMITSKRWQRSY